MLISLGIALALPWQWLNTSAPERAAARSPVQVGTSFRPQQARSLGLDYQAAFKQLVAMHFRVIRLSAYWDEIDRSGYGELDWLMWQARRAGQPVVLTVGMKGVGWPEYYVPEWALTNPPKDGADIAQDRSLRTATETFIETTVDRYSHNPALYAWQVENEPFNRAGPHQWWIDSNFVHQEVLTVKRLDSRPVILTAFGSFNLVVDRGSGHRGLSLSSLLGFDTDGAEQESLGSIGKGDIFGLDVYNRIGFRLLGRDLVSSAGRDWSSRATAWVGRAERQRKDAWVTELQAEPWEASPVSYAHPKSISPRGVVTNFHAVADGGYDTVLLWGSEYWLWRARHGDNRWVRAVGAILRQESNAAPLKPGLKRA